MDLVSKVRHKKGIQKKNNTRKLGSTVGLVKRNCFRAPTKKKDLKASFQHCSSQLICYRLWALSTDNLGKTLPTVADTASNKEVEGKDDPQQSHLKHPLTSAGSICSVLYRERQSFKISFPQPPSLFSVAHLVSITVASLTHGLLVTLVWREKMQAFETMKLRMIAVRNLKIERNPTCSSKMLGELGTDSQDDAFLPVSLGEKTPSNRGKRACWSVDKRPEAWGLWLDTDQHRWFKAQPFGLTWAPWLLGWLNRDD